MSGVALEVVHSLANLILSAADPSPEPEDVKAGWGAFAIFIGGIVAVALLGWSLVRQLRKAQAAEDAGVYGRDEQVPAGSPESESRPTP